MASAAVTATASSGSPPAMSATSDPDTIATVDAGPTISCGDEPRAAYASNAGHRVQPDLHRHTRDAGIAERLRHEQGGDDDPGQQIARRLRAGTSATTGASAGVRHLRPSLARPSATSPPRSARALRTVDPGVVPIRSWPHRPEGDGLRTITPVTLAPGDQAPAITLLDQHGDPVALASSLAGHKRATSCTSTRRPTRRGVPPRRAG